MKGEQGIDEKIERILCDNEMCDHLDRNKARNQIKRAILEEIEKMIYSTIPDSSFYKFKMLKALDDIRKLLGEGDSPSNKSKGSGI